jgi:hypothetical protein
MPGIVGDYSTHSFRATGITNFLENGGTLEVAQTIAGHADSRTTKLYDRRHQKESLARRYGADPVLESRYVNPSRICDRPFQDHGRANPNPPRRQRDYLVLLQQKKTMGSRSCLVDGQPVNYWAAFIAT